MKVPLLDLKEQNESLRPEIEARSAKGFRFKRLYSRRGSQALEKELAEYCGTKIRHRLRFGNRRAFARADGFRRFIRGRSYHDALQFFCDRQRDHAARREAGFRRHRPAHL
jgi:hypothetical protein